MTVQDTSREAYDFIKPLLGERQREVLVVLEDSTVKLCNQDIADRLGWPINTVTPRVKELREMGMVEESHRAPYGPTGRTVMFWKTAA